MQTFLLATGIVAGRLMIAGYGENMPLEQNDSVLNKQLNRRVEVVVEQGAAF